MQVADKKMNTPKRYRQKPFKFEAIQVTGDNLQAIKTFCNLVKHNKDNKLIIAFGTAEAPVEFELKPGHWIMKDQFGDFASATERFLSIYEEDKDDA